MSVSPARPPTTTMMPTAVARQAEPPQHQLNPDASNSVPRPLLPRLQSLTTASFLGMMTSPKIGKRARTNVTVACDGCKQARAKCDGKQPCQRCTKRSSGCRYDQAHDRRQHRGSTEEIQALTARLVRYQRVIYLLRNSSPRDAASILQRLRLTSDADAASDQKPLPPTDVTFVAAVQFLLQTEHDSPTATSLEETAALVDCVRHDMDDDPPPQHSPTTTKKPSPAPPGRENDETPRPKTHSRADFTVQGLLCQEVRDEGNPSTQHLT
ncbi:hypothetical protein Z517_06330 [Fonsecaea pedrosoi CBS 271.37]|uniref:Zn(2)-C6 fungal-type domain-containing protein n=1 Tax=Fonsecaea pedrosoi CBS 271.37 TaxID=1442368 RepID=A0A0D2DPP0_9EURO|nr:uncharacterized protein Z517_06330 [Fonsecaea pedrosoi CBS 271.37]KIW79716.1 hypothetical protein Z517_06330 [Fonsecaea pedrosoi CBS 271.37]